MKTMKVITDVKVMDCTSNEGIVTYYESKPIKCLPIDDIKPTLPAPEIITKYVKGTEFRMMDRDGKVYSTIIGFTDDVYEALNFPLQAMSETVERCSGLIEKNIKLSHENAKIKSKFDNLNNALKSNTEALVNYKKGILTMSFWKRFKFLFGGEPQWT